MPDTTPASAPRYNVATLLDMAKIPEDRLPAFLAELPRLLGDIRAIVRMADTLGKDRFEVIPEHLVWVDDGIMDGSADEKYVRIEHAP